MKRRWLDREIRLHLCNAGGGSACPGHFTQTCAAPHCSPTPAPRAHRALSARTLVLSAANPPRNPSPSPLLDYAGRFFQHCVVEVYLAGWRAHPSSTPWLRICSRNRKTFSLLVAFIKRHVLAPNGGPAGLTGERGVQGNGFFRPAPLLPGTHPVHVDIPINVQKEIQLRPNML